MRQSEVQKFWVGHLMDLAKLRFNADIPLFDGFYIDGVPASNQTHFSPKGTISPEHQAEYNVALFAMLKKLTDALDKAGAGSQTCVIMCANFKCRFG